MNNKAKTAELSKDEQLKKASTMAAVRAMLPIIGLVLIFIWFNFRTGGRMISNLSLALSSVYSLMIASTGVFFIMTMGGLDFSQGSILGYCIYCHLLCITESADSGCNYQRYRSRCCNRCDQRFLLCQPQDQILYRHDLHNVPVPRNY